MTHPSVPNIGCHPRILSRTVQDHLWTHARLCFVSDGRRQVVHYELLPTVAADLYSQQLERVQQALHQKETALVNRKGEMLLHDNARSHFARVARNTIQRHGWETLCHPPYSPDLAPSDYHLFTWIIIFVVNPSPMKQACAKLSRTSLRLTPPSFTARGLSNWRHVGRMCWMPMVITLRTNNRLRCLYVMFF
ncbi:histone-lysine N-methyltransferase SETMAR [Trichonephila clavipes]|nr:histone-lysine N-methyltransferase SETMAR [Trichonephila clavipes]